VKSYDRPQKEPRIFSPPALLSDSLELRRPWSMGKMICFSLRAVGRAVVQPRFWERMSDRPREDAPDKFISAA
jgi:hypothetical protein